MTNPQADPWSELQFMLIKWKPSDRSLLAKCKFAVEGRRCNAKFRGDDAVIKAARHLWDMHRFRFNWPKRFSGKIGKGNERAKGDGK